MLLKINSKTVTVHQQNTVPKLHAILHITHTIRVKMMWTFDLNRTQNVIYYVINSTPQAPHRNQGYNQPP